MLGRLEEIVVDCRLPSALVRFWAVLLGGEPVDRDFHWSYVDPPSTPRIAFQRVPEPRPGAKNRLHLDVTVEAIEPVAATLVRLGARHVGGVVTDERGSFQTMLDPEGNEFCLLAA